VSRRLKSYVFVDDSGFRWWIWVFAVSLPKTISYAKNIKSDQIISNHPDKKGQAPVPAQMIIDLAHIGL